MIPLSRRAEPEYHWTGRHLYEVWQPSGRRVWMGSIVRDGHRKVWSAWRRGEHLGSFSDQEGARGAVEEYAKEHGKQKI
jgi:hypothetical protein